MSYGFVALQARPCVFFGAWKRGDGEGGQYGGVFLGVASQEMIKSLGYVRNHTPIGPANCDPIQQCSLAQQTGFEACFNHKISLAVRLAYSTYQ